ncbi:MAG: 8-amino-7-oxononanoate synthase [Chloroflexi bacterium]|nr:MAG: 8-amino-7-oxononanoate synthase [Chloroflexota bacterium]
MEQKALQFMRQRLDLVHSQHLYRQLRTVSAGAATWIEVEGHKVLNLSSNNYLGLATRPVLQAAASAAAQADGWGAGSSRLIAGDSKRHKLLEARLASFKHAESALLFNSGYTANVGVISSLSQAGDLILSDELNHASIIDGCRLSRAECKVFPHCNVAALAELLAAAVQTGRQRTILVVTDTVFSMDGDLAPLREIARLCTQYDALLVVDEAHATGCIGPAGRGLVAQLEIEYEAVVAISTLSKALGSFGAFVTGPQLVKDYLINTARNFIFTTALPPPVIAASLAALDILEQEPELVEQLQTKATFFRQGLQQLGFNTLTSQTHIIPILIGDAALALEMAQQLLAQGVFAVAIRPPTVPPGTSRIRTSLMATHTQGDLHYALSTFEDVGRKFGIIG